MPTAPTCPTWTSVRCHYSDPGWYHFRIVVDTRPDYCTGTLGGGLVVVACLGLEAAVGFDADLAKRVCWQRLAFCNSVDDDDGDAGDDDDTVDLTGVGHNAVVGVDGAPGGPGRDCSHSTSSGVAENC